MINFDMLVETRIQTVSVIETAQGYDVLILILDHEMNNWTLIARSVTRFNVNYMCLHKVFAFCYICFVSTFPKSKKKILKCFLTDIIFTKSDICRDLSV